MTSKKGDNGPKRVVMTSKTGDRDSKKGGHGSQPGGHELEKGDHTSKTALLRKMLGIRLRRPQVFVIQEEPPGPRMDKTHQYLRACCRMPSCCQGAHQSPLRLLTLLTKVNCRFAPRQMWQLEDAKCRADSPSKTWQVRPMQPCPMLRDTFIYFKNQRFVRPGKTG